MKVKEKQANQSSTVPTVKAEIVSSSPTDIEVRTKGRYIFSGKLWGKGEARIEHRLWRLFWIFLTISGFVGVVLGVWISIYFDLTTEYGWWSPIILSLILGFLLAWLIIPLFYNVLVPWISAHSEVKSSEQS